MSDINSVHFQPTKTGTNLSAVAFRCYTIFPVLVFRRQLQHTEYTKERVNDTNKDYGLISLPNMVVFTDSTKHSMSIYVINVKFISKLLQKVDQIKAHISGHRAPDGFSRESAALGALSNMALMLHKLQSFVKLLHSVVRRVEFVETGPQSPAPSNESLSFYLLLIGVFQQIFLNFLCFTLICHILSSAPLVSSVERDKA